MSINNLNFIYYEKIPSFWSSPSSPWSSSSRSWWLHVLMQCRHMIQLKSGIIVPCGKCASCLANNRQEWVFRLQQEYLNSSFALFVTLTYDDVHLPLDMSVNKRDVQLFHKRLRKHFESGDLRYFLVSEYGDQRHRPHYHGLYFFKELHNLEDVYDIFLKSWTLGFIKFGNVELASILYCTKYCLKGGNVPEGRKKAFRLISKMSGGLGSYYLEKMSSYHIDNEQFSFVSSQGRKCRMPRYYRDKLKSVSYTFHPELAERAMDDKLQKMREDFMQRYFDWLKRNNRVSCSESMQLFNEFCVRSRDVQDDLVFKHTKKQNEF